MGVALLALMLVAPAQADVSSWFYAGGGLASTAWAPSPTKTPGTLALELGMGSSPDKPVIFGALAKSLTYFSQGTDLALAARGATGGYVRGDFGVALDLGAYRRFWEAESTGFLGALVLGAPFGLQLVATVQIGSNDARVFGATLGIDFLRLTVYRTALQSFWPNPMPPRHESKR